ncbi:B12-binding domain-containing radical SAM protein [Clostridium hydrogenum]|uniref:B12-binding domain-containing radical SAM protein n=1 Tax=Clostridium hydrogenum TaxID=2855764 RepID=UPI001F1BCBE0|nr:B12-binding domain-containing radical SAM protein [Clostridium hydrogenum]
MEKVLLTAVNSQYIHSNLAVRYLKAYTKDIDFDIRIKEFSINDRLEKVFDAIMNEKPNLVAFSCYIWNIEYVEKLSNLIKRVDPNIQILYGGPEVTYDSRKFLLESVGDFVIEGEGEETFREFLLWKLKYGFQNKDCKIEGLYSRSHKEIIYGGKRELMNMNSLVFPYAESDDLSNKIVYYEFSRGCPFKCKYCLSSTIRGVRFLDIERTKRELKFLSDKKVKLVKFVDRTFNANPKYAIELWKFISNLDTETLFHFEISADILTDEEIETLKNVPKGRIQFEVGVQTTNNEVLYNVNRFVNFEDIKEKVTEIEKIKNIKQHLDLIAGLPGEDYKSFIKSFNDVYLVIPDELQLGFLKLLKGSPMRMEADMWGMVYSPYPPYEILKTKDISFDEIMKLKRVEAVVDKYYNSGKFSNIVNYLIKKYETPYDFYYELGQFYYKKGYYNRNVSGSGYYGVFLEFNSEVLKEDDSILKEIIKYDYLKYNKRSWLPAFLDRYNQKSEENEIKDMLKERNEYDKDMHLEKFAVDIREYINETPTVLHGNYVLFK